MSLEGGLGHLLQQERHAGCRRGAGAGAAVGPDLAPPPALSTKGQLGSLCQAHRPQVSASRLCEGRGRGARPCSHLGLSLPDHGMSAKLGGERGSAAVPAN